jgi:hypothetical protein
MTSMKTDGKLKSSSLRTAFALPWRVIGRAVHESRILLEEARWRRQERVSVVQTTLKAERDGSNAQTAPRNVLTSQFFNNRDDQAYIRKLLTQVNPSAAETIITEADQYCAHVFNLLGSGQTNLGPTIDWHTDFISGYQWNQRRYYKKIHPSPFPGSYDIKVPWELSRCQHFVRLGQAYWITDNEEYALEFVAQVQDWISCNPWPWGVNWASTMDVAIRAVNWLWGYHFFKGSNHLSEQFSQSFYQSLLVHGQHIFHNLENRTGVTGNHYLSNLVGLIYVGILCPNFKEAREWREFGLRELEIEMLKQVYSDGADFEASTSYHRLVLEMFLSTTVLALRNDHCFSPDYMSRLEKMLEFAMHLSRPDGTSPLVGDSDNGRLHRLKTWKNPEQEWNDFRYLLAIGGCLFSREEFLLAAGGELEEAIWLLPQHCDLHVALSSATLQCERASRRFGVSGFYVLHTSDVHLLVERGEVGLGGKGSHNHYNPLGFELWMNGCAIVVDPGTYAYTGDWLSREQYRNSAQHNTLYIELPDFMPTYPPRNLFGFERLYSVRELAWDVNRHYDVLVLERTSTAGKRSVTHRRTIVLWKEPAMVAIRDSISGTEAIPCVFSLHFSSALVARQVSISGVMAIALAQSDHEICICTRLSPSWSMTLVEGWVSPSYGVRHPATTARFTSKLSNPMEPLELFFHSPHVTLAQNDIALREIRALLSEGALP